MQVDEKKMKREIKFRAWDYESKRMFNVFSLSWSPKGEFLDASDPLYLEDMWVPGEKHSIEIMQFTGLYDKNGKEIYEGDILENEDESLIVAEWYPDGFWYPFTSGASCGCCGPYTDWDKENEREVIGNIYENPEIKIIDDDDESYWSDASY